MQTTKLARLENKFESTNRVRCFNHTIQLAAKALLQPLNPAIAGKDEGDTWAIGENENNDLPLLTDSTDDEEPDGDEAAAGDSYTIDLEQGDDPNDGIDELEVIGNTAKEQIVDNTEIVRGAVTKVYLYFIEADDNMFTLHSSASLHLRLCDPAQKSCPHGGVIVKTRD
jgi:hypothetical protein